MPNWVNNEMRVYGNKKDLIKFKDHLTGGGESYFSFEKIIPQPIELSAWAEDGIPGWYKWRVEHWGTKWDTDDVKLSCEGDHLFYEFSTANSPPFPIYFSLAETYTALDMDVIISELINDWSFELATEHGHYTKFIGRYLKYIPWRSIQYKILHYKADYLKKTLQVVKEEILDEP